MMKRKLFLNFELEDEEFDALQEHANGDGYQSVENMLATMVEIEVANIVDEILLSDEDLRELKHEYFDDQEIDRCHDLRWDD